MNYLVDIKSGIVAVLVGTGVAILVGMATDKMKGHIKITIVVLLTLGILNRYLK